MKHLKFISLILSVVFAGLLLSSCTTGFYGNSPQQINGISFVCNGVVSDTYDSSCTLIDGSGVEVTGVIVIEGKVYDGETVFCDADGDGLILFEIYVPDTWSADISTDMNDKRIEAPAEVAGMVRVYERTFEKMRGSGENARVYESSSTDSITDDIASNIATSECSCRLYDVYAQSEATTPNIAEAEISQKYASTQAREIIDRNVTNWYLMGSYCDVNEFGEVNCVEGMLLSRDKFARSLDAELIGVGENGEAIIRIIYQNPTTSTYSVKKFNTFMDGAQVEMANAELLAPFALSEGADSADVKISSDGKIYSLLTTKEIIGRGNTVYGINVCSYDPALIGSSGRDSLLYQCQEIYSGEAYFPRLEIDKESGQVMAFYMIQNDRNDYDVYLAVGPDFSPELLASGVSNYDLFFASGKIYLAWSESEATYPKPLNSHLLIYDIASGAIESDMQVTDLGEYYTSGHPHVVVDSIGRIYYEVGVSYYHSLGQEIIDRKIIDQLEPAPEGTTGLFIYLIGTDGSITQKHLFEDGWISEVAPNGVLSVDGYDRLIFSFSAFDRIKKKAIIQ